MTYYLTPQDTVRPSDIRRKRQAFMSALDEVEPAFADVINLFIDDIALMFMREGQTVMYETALGQATDFAAELVWKKLL